MKAPSQIRTGLRLIDQGPMHDHDHQQRNIGYQDAMHDLQECIKVVGYCNDAPLFWLEHGRNWKEHL